MKTNKPKSSGAFGLTTCLLSFFGLSISNAKMPASFLVPLAAELEPDKKVIYKKAGDRELELHLFHPRNFQPATDRRPVFLIIHGGGWTGGEPRKFYPIARYRVMEDGKAEFLGLTEADQIPWGLTLSPDGKFLLVSATNGASLTAYRISKDGNLKKVSTLPWDARMSDLVTH
jgi:6-phosphogluconolactonase (cycloisomerase 2 family)